MYRIVQHWLYCNYIIDEFTEEVVPSRSDFITIYSQDVGFIIHNGDVEETKKIVKSSARTFVPKNQDQMMEVNLGL